tara:strand:- start:173 stop:799 length:627 start_codon:yes stop_codon:yes gene_type:complete
MGEIKVVNFPFCNFFSLERYLRISKKKFSILDEYNTLCDEDIAVIPGVGTFGEGMSFLRKYGLDKQLLSHALKGGKIIGICLGMQMLFNTSEECHNEDGLGLIPGRCKKIPESKEFRVPHIGWNSLEIQSENIFFSKNLKLSNYLSERDFYFVHSYYVLPNKEEFIIAKFSHPSGFLSAAVNKNNVIGFQFHPEKSGKAGYDLLDEII